MTVPRDIRSWPEHSIEQPPAFLQQSDAATQEGYTAACRLIVEGLRRLIAADLLTTTQADAVLQALLAGLHSEGEPARGN
jgi:hypothetical protein